MLMGIYDCLCIFGLVSLYVVCIWCALTVCIWYLMWCAFYVQLFSVVETSFFVVQTSSFLVDRGHQCGYEINFVTDHI